MCKTVWAICYKLDGLHIEYLFSSAAMAGEFLVMLKQEDPDDSWTILPIELDPKQISSTWWKR